MLKKIFMAGLALVMLPMAAWADPTGNFKVRGKNYDGQTYEGRVRIQRTGETYTVVWNIAGTEFVGTGLGAKFIGERFQMGPASPEDTAISVGYISGRSFGMAMYFEQPDGTWQGIWTFGGSDRASTENWYR